MNSMSHSPKLVASRVGSNAAEQRSSHQDFDRLSMLSKISFKNNLSENGRDGRARAEAHF
jgi:hypothetical protein